MAHSALTGFYWVNGGIQINIL